MNRTLMRLGLVTVTLISVTFLSGIPPTTATVCPAVPDGCVMNIPLPGTKMQLSDTSGPGDRRNYVALRDGDQSVPFPAPTITGATASIGRVGAGEVTVLDLPASGWSGSPTTGDYKFKSRSGAVISARLNAGRSIRLSARGDAAYPLGGTPQGGVGIIIDVGGVRFCGFFGGTIVKDDGQRFRARTAPAPAGCPILGTTTTTTTTTTSTTSTTSTSTSTTTSTTVVGLVEILEMWRCPWVEPDGTPCGASASGCGSCQVDCPSNDSDRCTAECVSTRPDTCSAQATTTPTGYSCTTEEACPMP